MRVPLFRKKHKSLAKKKWSSGHHGAVELWKKEKFPKQPTAEQKAAVEAFKQYQRLIRDAMPRRKLNSADRADARWAEKSAMLRMKDEPVIKVSDSTKLQTALNIYNLESLRKGYGKEWLHPSSAASKMWKSVSFWKNKSAKEAWDKFVDYWTDTEGKPNKDFRKYWWPKKLVMVCLYSVRGVFRVAFLPVSFPTGLLTQWIRKSDIKAQLRDIQKSAGDETVQMHLAYLGDLQKQRAQLSDDKKREGASAKWAEEAAKLGPLESDAFKKMKERKKRKRAA